MGVGAGHGHRFNRNDVALIPIDDLPPLPLGLVWCTSRENPRIRALNEIASSMTTAPERRRISFPERTPP